METPENKDEELFEHYSYIIDTGQEPLRVDKFLLDKIPNTSRSKLQNAAKQGFIHCNGISVKQNYRVKPQDAISVMLPYPVREIELIPEDIPVKIEYEDNDLVIIHKPSNMVVHPGHGNYTGTLVNALMFHFKNLPQSHTSPQSPRPGLVHRLDKNTTGLMVIAKTEQAMTHLAKQFFDRTIERHYHALVWGDVKEEEGTIEGHIGRSLKNRKVFMVYPQAEIGKPAKTHYKVLERFGYITLIECKLETGRTHQIRVHLKHINHTLFGDFEYGGDKVLRGTTFTKYKQFVENCFKILPRQALHAKSLGLIHPTTGKKMHFQSDLPDDMLAVIEKWRAYTGNR